MKKINSPIKVDSCIAQRAAVREGKVQFHALTKGHYPGVPIEPHELPGINSIGFLDSDKEQDWGLEPHRNEGIEITFLETGSMVFTADSRPTALRSGHFTVTRPWQLHQLGAPNLGPGRLDWLILDVKVRRPNQEWRWPQWVTLTGVDRAELTRRLRDSENNVWDASPEIAAVFHGLSDEVLHWKRPQAESRMLNLLNQLLLGILVVLNGQSGRPQPEPGCCRRKVELFLRDLAENEASSARVWTLPEMAAHCGMCMTSFANHCHELVNIAPVEYLIRCRLQHAARQLKKCPTVPVTEVAFQHGFNSSQYFATAFRKRFKTTPHAYREQAVEPSRRNSG